MPYKTYFIHIVVITIINAKSDMELRNINTPHILVTNLEVGVYVLT